MALKAIGAYRNEKTNAIIRAVEAQANYTFNPSVRVHNGDLVVALRTSDVATGPVRASLIVLDGESFSIRPGTGVDLTTMGAEHGIAPVADPKLFTYQGVVWATFNTGFVREGNEIYVMPVYPEIGTPVRCEVEDRQPIEKNWGFFESGRGELQAIYSLDPLIILNFGVVDDSVSVIKGDVVSKSANPGCARLTIGTQPVAVDRGHLLIAHERIGPKRLRGYFGRAVSLELAGPEKRAMVSNRRLLHGWLTLLGTRPRRNRHLWFATYFSGLEIDGDDAVMLYGINDQRAGGVALPVPSLTAM